MAEEIVQLGLDARGAVRGAQAYDAALDGVIAKATGAADANERLQGELARLSAVGRAAAAAIGFVGFGALAKETLEAGAEMDSLRRGLVAVTGSAAEAAKQLKELEDVAKAPGLGFKEAIQGAIRLEAVGISAQQAERALKAFGNAVATTGGGKNELDRITFQLGQMAAKGKVLANDLRPIIETAPVVGKALKDAFGTVDADQISALGITAEEFIDKLVAQLEKLPPVTGGAKNAFENLSDAATRAADAVSQQVLPALAAGAEGATAFLQAIAEADPERIRAGLDAIATAAEFVAAVYGTKLVLAIGKFAAGEAAGIAASRAAAVASAEQAHVAEILVGAKAVDAAQSVRDAEANLALALGMGRGEVAMVEQTAAAVRLAAAKEALVLADANLARAEVATATAIAGTTTTATAATAGSRALALVGGTTGLAILGVAAAGTALFKILEHYAEKSRETGEETRRLADSQKNLADHFANVSREAAKAAQSVLAAGRAQAEARLAALGEQAAPLQARVRAGTTTKEVPVFADVGGTSVQTGTRTVQVLSRDAQDAARALAPLQKQIAEAATQVTGYAQAQNGLNLALARFAAQDAKAAADATAKQLKRYQALRDETAAQIEDQQKLAAAYRLGAAAGDEAADRLELEAQVRKAAKTLTEAQEAALLALARAQKAAENDTAFAKTLADSQRQIEAQRSLAAAYAVSAEAGKRREDGLKNEAEVLTRAKDAGVGYAAALLLQGKSEDQARAAIAARLQALGESEAQAKADASAQADRARALAETVVAEQKVAAAVDATRSSVDLHARSFTTATERITQFSNEFRRFAKLSADFLNASRRTVRAPTFDLDRKDSGVDAGVQDAQRNADAIKAIYEEAIKGIQRSFADGWEKIFTGGAQGFHDLFADAVHVALSAASQIAGAFTAKALGFDALLKKVEDGALSFDPSKGLIGGTKGKVASGLVGFGIGQQTGDAGFGAIGGVVSGAALAGPVGAVLGGVGGLVGGLLGHARKAHEAAEAMKAAQDAFQRSLDDTVAGIRADSDFGRSVVDLTRTMHQQLLDFAKAFDLKDPFGAKDFRNVHTFENIPGSTPDQTLGRAQDDVDSLRNWALTVKDPALRAALEDQVEIWQDMIDKAKEAQEAAKKALDQDLQVRLLRAKGLDDEADRLARQYAEAKELDDAIKQFGADSPLIAFLKQVQEAEDAAAAAAKRAADAAKARDEFISLRGFEANLLAKQADARGDTVDAARIRAREQASQELDNARKLYEAGTITSDMFKQFAAVLENDVARAVEEAAKAAKRAAEDLKETIDERGLRAEGKTADADLLRFLAQENRDIEDMADALKKGQITQADFDRFVNVIVPKEIANFKAQQAQQSAAQQALGEQTPVRRLGEGPSQVAVQQDAAAVSQRTEVTGEREVDIGLSQLVYLKQIELNTRRAGTPGPALPTLGFAAPRLAPFAAPSSGGNTLTVNVTFSGPVVTEDADVLAKIIAQAVNEELGMDLDLQGSYGTLPSAN